MSKRVFELANDFGMRPLDLVEKLKSAGFSVRNHMASLSDDDVTKALELLNAEKKDVADTKTAKKKVAKKKVAKKKVAKKAAKKKDDTDDSSTEEAVVKKVPKRKVVVRRKTSAAATSKEDETEAAPAVEAAATEAVEYPAAQVEVEKIRMEEESLHKLNIVQDAPKPETEEPEIEIEIIVEEKKDVFKEKMHTFTPVFIPEKKPESEKPKETTYRKATPDEAPSLDDKDGKKRLGGLAAALSKPKAPGKTRDLTTMRAEEEMKQYNMTGLKGTYVPARRKRNYSGPSKDTIVTEVKDSKRVVIIHKGAWVEDFSQNLSQKFDNFANECLKLNLLIHKKDFLGPKLCEKIAALWDYRVEDRAFDEDKILEKEVVEDTSHLPVRNPIITVMGHVDHGKTTLLDYIRKEKVASGEAGGITQHIGAYSVKVKKSTITFLDTPGHAAFGAMRQRGADVTDLVVLVVAADDGVMPQTKESIKFCQNSGCPIIIAVNKMDKEGANVDRIKNELMEFSLTPEEWGGDTQYIPVSALKGDGVDDLLEAIQLQTEIMDLRADPKGKAEGVVIESRIESGRGPVSTILVQKGTLKKGDSIVCGETYGRARSLMDFTGSQLKDAGPSMPIQVLGLNEAAVPGVTFNIAKNEREAKKVVENRVTERKALENTAKPKVNTLEDFFANATAEGEQEKKVLKLIIRSDVQGSFEAIKTALHSLGNEEVGVEVISGGVGAINDSDVSQAESMNGYIIGFNMRPMTSSRKLAEQKGVDIKTYTIIYELIDDVKAALEGMLDPERVEVYIGRAEVKDTFSVPKIGTIAGSAVIDGKIKKGCNIRLLREEKIMFDGEMSSLKRFKDDVKEVGNGLECGIGLKSYDDIKVGDLFEAYMFEEKKRTLESNLTL